jgi:ABC-type glycerol-3-phosphate transport system permease component
MGYGLCSYFLLGPKQRNPLRLAILYGFGLPVLLLFLALQRQYMEGLLAGSVKG